MKKRVLIISIIALVITLIGSTYAFFMYSKTTKAFTLTSGDINIEFVNGDNNINLTYAYPISDNYAKDNLEKLGYIDFSINGKITEDKKVINYEIYLEEDSKNTLDSNYIKVYLTDDTNKEIVSPTTYNSLDKTSYTNSSNGKVIYKVSKKGEFNDKYRIYVWIDSKYSQNTVQERFSFKVNLYAYNDNETAVSVIKSKLVKYEESSKDDFSGGLVAVNTDGELYNETDASESIREYRYSGPSVDNYVTFNDEEWRIIGVFTDEKGAEHVKIVRNLPLESNIIPTTYLKETKNYNLKDKDTSNGVNYYNYDLTNNNNSINDWATAGLQFFLNTEQDDSSNPKYGYLHYLSLDAKNMIEDAKYYLGNIKAEHNSSTNQPDVLINTKEAYNEERTTIMCDSTITSDSHTKNCSVWSNNQPTWIGKIGLMYLSDYGYSANSNFWNNTTFCYFQSAAESSWLKKINGTWLLNPVSTNTSMGISTFDIVQDVLISNKLYDAYPTLYLKSNVKITRGTGKVDSPYSLSIE